MLGTGEPDRLTERGAKMKRVMILTLVLGLLTGMLGGTALAHEDEEIPEHGHILVLGLEFDEDWEIAGYRKCVDLANARALRNNAHHEGIHDGKAGAKLFEKAGHAVAPTAPLWPEVTSCADFEALFGG
jgi:hypothetical protein